MMNNLYIAIEERGYDHEAHIAAIELGDWNAISTTHPFNWMTEDEAESDKASTWYSNTYKIISESPAPDQLAFIVSPGHGWLRVPMAFINQEDYTEYSYFNDQFAYLEEDCDAGRFLSKHPDLSFADIKIRHVSNKDIFLDEVYGKVRA